MRRLQTDGRPLYARAKEAIRELLAERELEAGDRIPPEQELVGLLGASRSTIREALKALAHEGLLVSRQGSGTFVADETPLLWAGLETLRSTTALFAAQGLRPSVRHLRVAEEIADATSAARLGLQPGEPLVVVERVRAADDQPICYVRDELIPLPGLVDAYRADRPESLLAFLRGRYGVTIDHSLCEVRAAAASAAIGRALDAPRGRPLIRLDQVHVDTQRRPIFFSRSHWRTDRFVFRILRRVHD